VHAGTDGEAASARPSACTACRADDALGFDITMAFQPILDLAERRVFAYEALVRGRDGASAGAVLEKVDEANRYRFDQACRVTAIELAASLGLAAIPDCRLSINFLPNAVYRPETCIRATLAAARRVNMPPERLMFEVTEAEQVADPAHLKRIFDHYRQRGFTTAIDDFGAGYAGLNLLVGFQPHVIKLDMELTRGIDADPVRQAIVGGILQVTRQLGIRVVAEGIETAAEHETLAAAGVRYMQGYLFARPALERLIVPDYP
jgi:EAL domain-containing protein (putative c-di-GMP-specific phosphodiesterase class I)